MLTSPGEIVNCDDQWPIITFRLSHTVQLPGLTAEELARRVAACVNFCRGVDLDSVGQPTLRDLIASIDEPDAQARREINQRWPLIKPGGETSD